MNEILEGAENQPKEETPEFETTATKVQGSEQPEAGGTTPEPRGFAKGDKVTFREETAEITAVHPDGSLDVQLVDKEGNVKRDEAEQPYWYPSVLPENVKAR